MMFFPLIVCQMVTGEDLLKNIWKTLQGQQIKRSNIGHYYTIMGNELFKKTLKGILLKCHSENEAYVAVFDVHGGSCWSHQQGH